MRLLTILIFVCLLPAFAVAKPVKMQLPYGDCEAKTEKGRSYLKNYLKCRSGIKATCSAQEDIKQCAEDESKKCAVRYCRVINKDNEEETNT